MTFCSIDLVRGLGNLMLDINGQFDEQGLLNTKTHRDLLDKLVTAFAEKVKKSLTELSQLQKNLEVEYKK